MVELLTEQLLMIPSLLATITPIRLLVGGLMVEAWVKCRFCMIPVEATCANRPE